MSCDICGRGSCIPSFHPLWEQKRFEDVIAAFDRARDMREQLIKELDEEAAMALEEDDESQSDD